MRLEISIIPGMCMLVTLGTTVMAPLAAQERSVVVAGSVTEETSGSPVGRVSIVISGQQVATTDRDGRFQIDRVLVDGSILEVAFQRIGFQRRFESVTLAAEQDRVELNVTLIRFPTVLEEITVDGRQVTIRNPGLIGFYERRDEGYGRYVTQEDIDRSIGFDLSNVYRRLRMPEGCTPLTPVVVYLDGIRVPPMPNQGSALDRVNDLVMPGQVGGIEVYADERAVRLPSQFVPAGPYCGVVMFWTRQPKGPSAARVYAHVSSGFGQPNASRVGLGGGLAFPLRNESTLEFQAAVQAVLEGGRDAWRAFVDATGKPFGSTSPWYVGLGMTLSKPRSGINSTDQGLRGAMTALSGFRIAFGGLHPFAEVRVVDVIKPNDAVVLTLFGLGVQFGG